MNFILRNLGWILLFLFFLFMLFVISTNQKNQPVSLSGATQTGTEQSSTGASEDLKNLVEKIETQQDTATGESATGTTSPEETATGKTQQDATPEKKSIFDIFKRKTQETPATGGTVSTGTTLSQTGSVSEEQTQQATPSATITHSPTSSVKPTTTAQGLTKSTGKTVALSGQAVQVTRYLSPTASYARLQKMYGLPGKSLLTEVGKEFQVGVTSLKLNDKTFTKKLAYLKQGDVVEQLTAENTYGCFQVKIVSSAISGNEGKIGYVCKKYLKDVSANSDQQDSYVAPSTPSSQGYTTSVGSYFTITSDDTIASAPITGNLVLQKGDIVKQLSVVDTLGCFSARVVGENVERNLGKLGIICSSMVVPLIGN